MPFEKGKSGNPSGKPKGAKNRVTENLREIVSSFLEGNFSIIQADFKKLKPRDRARLYVDLLQYGLPKLQATSLEIDFENMSDEQLDYIIEQLKNTGNGQGTKN